MNFFFCYLNFWQGWLAYFWAGNSLEVSRIDLMILTILNILNVADKIISLQLEVHKEQFFHSNCDMSGWRRYGFPPTPNPPQVTKRCWLLMLAI
jgi:hypothetical protein